MIKNWIKKNCNNLNGKLVALTGSTGDLAKEICYTLASLGANLLFLNRNKTKTEKLKSELLNLYNIKIYDINVNLESFASVKEACQELLNYDIDYFILSAGAYKIERRISDIGYDNVFQINFVSQYYLARKVIEKMETNKKGKIVIVSSIAHNYSKINQNDIDFKNNKHCTKVYGNSKRFFTFAMFELFKDLKYVKLAVTHPGISYTNITGHYPKWLLVIIKYPMKIIFPKPKKAALSIIKGIYENCNFLEWIGPKYFNVWGYPKTRVLKTATSNEILKINQITEEIYQKISIEKGHQ